MQQNNGKHVRTINTRPCKLIQYDVQSTPKHRTAVQLRVFMPKGVDLWLVYN